MQFSTILNQQDLKCELLTQAKSPKLHHAHLMVGEMGFNTFALGMAFVKYLYCQNKREDDSCNECKNCVKINKNIHADIKFYIPTFADSKKDKDFLKDFLKFATENHFLIDIEDLQAQNNNNKNYKIRSEDIGELSEFLSFYSYEGSYKTVIIWYAETLDKESNKILKLLEEPPENTIFVLFTENTDKILPTVLSRCSIYNIKKYNEKEVLSYLNTLDKSNEESFYRFVNESCNGNLIKAKRIVKDFSNYLEIEENVIEILQTIIGLSSHKYNLSSKVFYLIEKINIKELKHLIYFFREVVKQKATAEKLEGTKFQKAINHFAEVMEIDQIESSISKINNCQYYIERNVSLKNSLVSLFIELSRIYNRKIFLANEIAKK